MRFAKSSAAALGVLVVVIGAGLAQERGQEPIGLPIGEMVTIRHISNVPSYVRGRLVGQDKDWIVVDTENDQRAWVGRSHVLTVDSARPPVPPAQPVQDVIKQSIPRKNY